MGQPDFEQLLERAIEDHGKHMAAMLASNTTEQDRSAAWDRAVDSHRAVREKYREDLNRLQDYAVQLQQAKDRIAELESPKSQEKPLVTVGVYRAGKIMDRFDAHMSSPLEFLNHYKRHAATKYGEGMAQMLIDALSRDEIKLELYRVEFQGATFG